MRIAVLDDYQGVAQAFADWSALPDDAEVVLFREAIGHEDAVAERLQDFEIICAMRERTPFPATLLRRLPNLKLLVTTGMRNASIDLEAAGACGVMVCGTASPAHATAELAMGLVLALARGIVSEAQSVRAGGWQVGVGRDVRGATLGIIGLGRLGGTVARMAEGFGMRLVAWSQNLTEARAAECGATLLTKEQLLAEADFVTIHLRLSDRSRGLIDRAALSLMKADAYLINTSRAPIVDTEALVDALRTKQIAGAALDVHDEEPLPPDAPLRQIENLLLTPHIGYVTRETYEVFYRETVEAVAAYLAGNPVRVLTP
ncbi:MAG: D-2-hydroxyacid dehydrogenase family protein [Alphaproteobacteria bacterium]|nr:D-2-hydroxyacid dehydrogenase family protein [Alphaproteobacteria bacterium]